MKYTRKQIEKAFRYAEKYARLNPSEMMSKERRLSFTVNEIAKMETEALINYINK
jgi:hypothetical protein